MEKIVNFTKKHTTLIIFFISLLIYIFFGLYLFFYNAAITDIWTDVVYGLDAGAKYNIQYVDLFRSQWLEPHPFIDILIKPYTFSLKYIILNSRLTSIFAQSLIAAFSCGLFYLCLEKLFNNKMLNLLFTFIFLFSYSNIIFSSISENYIYSGLVQILFLFLVFYIIKEQKEVGFIYIFILAVLSAFSFGINTINIVISLAISVFLICNNTKNLKKILKNILIFLLLFTAFSVFFVKFQNYVFNKKTTFISQTIDNFNTKDSMFECFNDFKMPVKLNYALKGTFIEPLYALEGHITEETYNLSESATGIFRDFHVWKFKVKQNPSYFIATLLFFIIPLFYAVKFQKNMPYKKTAVLLGFIVFLNFLFNVFWEADSCFLFSQNNLCYFLILIAFFYSLVPKKLAITFLSLFLSLQIPFNFAEIIRIENFVNYNNNHHNFWLYLFCAFVVSIAVSIVLFIFSKLTKNLTIEKKYAFFIILYFIFIVVWGLFVAFFGGKM